MLYRSATAMLADLAAKRVSARELLDAHVARNDALHAKLNMVIARDIERARRDAAAIDEARAKGATLGALAGLPMTIKDGFDVEGMPAVCSNPDYVGRDKACADAALIARARKAGAAPWGKTNVPIHLGDWQSFNAVYGTTNNPYDVRRVPGGSSGGSAAALASGVTPLEIGSDIGGSLRVPAHFCGVFALKPTWNLLPLNGHVPPPPGTVMTNGDLGVGGPMARTAADLRLLFGVLNDKPARAPQSVKGRRVAFWLDEPAFVTGRDVRDGLERAAVALRDAGAVVTPARPPVDAHALMDAYLGILSPIVGFAPWDPAAIAAASAKRDQLKAQLKSFFEEGWDAILAPVTPTPAFPHNQQGTMAERSLDVDGELIGYGRGLEWIALATALHPPALSVPAGRNAHGLPVGVQIIGRWNAEDALLDYADALDAAFGFTPPKL
jgi:amidase